MLARAEDGRPWLVVASFTHPHDPYVTRQQYWDRYDDVKIPMPTVSAADVADDPHSKRLRDACAMDRTTIADDDILRARRSYYGNISYIDDWTRTLVDTLAALKVADDTVVMLVADHGDMLGERGLWYKMNFFEGSARVPLVVHAPGRFQARRVATPVSLVDVLPTILQLAGGSPNDVVEPLAGQSLVSLCDGDEQARTVYGEYMAEGSCAPIVMIRRGDLKFVDCPADPDQLYDLSADPHEKANLAHDPAHATTVDGFRAEVATRWNLEQLAAEVLADQARRRLIASALRSGTFTPWDYTPPRDGRTEYMRNHLDLNDVERGARWPR